VCALSKISNDRVLAWRTMRRFGELDVVIADHFNTISPRVEEIQEPARQHLDVRRSQRGADRLFVIDHQPEMAPVIATLSAALLEGEELIAEIDESRPAALPAQFEVEQAAVEGQRLLDVANLERDVIQSDRTCFLLLGHSTLQHPLRLMWCHWFGPAI
jgi:hypothetical protein